MSVDPDEYKKVLRNWVSGVTVVTARSGDQVHGMTVSAFSSVSANPPLVLVCANRSSHTNEVIRKGRVFTVNILSAAQTDVSSIFAQSATDASRLDNVRWRAGENGAPILEGALASLECAVSQNYEEGSHTIYIGTVQKVNAGEADHPLVYYNGDYRKLNLD